LDERGVGRSGAICAALDHPNKGNIIYAPPLALASSVPAPDHELQNPTDSHLHVGRYLDMPNPADESSKRRPQSTVLRKLGARLQYAILDQIYGYGCFIFLALIGFVIGIFVWLVGLNNCPLSNRTKILGLIGVVVVGSAIAIFSFFRRR
jgi:hypothetical protein